MDTKHKGNKIGLRIVLSLVGILIVIAIIALVVWVKDGFSIDSINRAVTYRNIGSDEQTDTFRFDDRQSNTFALLGNGLIVASDQGYEYFSKNGEISDSDTLRMTKPALYSTGENAVVYDIGGKDFAVLDSGGSLFDMQTEYEIISAKINDDGWTAVCTTAETAKGIVTVYNSEGTGVYEFVVRSGYPVCAAISPDCTGMYVLLYTESGSHIVRYDFSDQEEKASFTDEEVLYIDIEYTSSSSVAAVSLNSVLWLDMAGETIGTYECESAYMGSYDIKENTLIYESEYINAQSGKFVLLDSSGTATAEYESIGTVRQIAYGGKYTGVLYSDRLAILDGTLNVYNESEDTGNASDILMRQDGAMLLISAFQATLYIP